MHNNDILRKIRYTFDLNDTAVIQLFGFGELEVTRPEISNWLKKDDDPDFKSLHDKQLAAFLNGFIILKRGKKEGAPAPIAEKTLNNNIILRKLKIALTLKDEDIIEILGRVDIRMSKPELSAFFRDSDHKHYRLCKDQFLRNFLFGMQVTYRKEAE